MKEIFLRNKGVSVMVDDEDFPWLSEYRWYARKSRSGWYACRAREGKTAIRMHREILERAGVAIAPRMVVDHLNGNPMDNRRENLDVCTTRENTARYHQGNDVGIAPNRGRWRAWVHLGCFETKESARAAREEALRRLGDDWFSG